MKKGDLVRFPLSKIPIKRLTDCGIWELKVGLLIEYHTWEKMATILCDGKIHRVHGSEVEKAGKRDGFKSN